MIESWLLRKRVEAKILVGELAEALGGQRDDEEWAGTDDDWAGAGFAVERVEEDFGRSNR